MKLLINIILFSGFNIVLFSCSNDNNKKQEEKVAVNNQDTIVINDSSKINSTKLFYEFKPFELKGSSLRFPINSFSNSLMKYVPDNFFQKSKENKFGYDTSKIEYGDFGYFTMQKMVRLPDEFKSSFEFQVLINDKYFVLQPDSLFMELMIDREVPHAPQYSFSVLSHIPKRVMPGFAIQCKKAFSYSITPWNELNYTVKKNESKPDKNGFYKGLYYIEIVKNNVIEKLYLNHNKINSDESFILNIEGKSYLQISFLNFECEKQIILVDLSDGLKIIKECNYGCDI